MRECRFTIVDSFVCTDVAVMAGFLFPTSDFAQFTPVLAVELDSHCGDMESSFAFKATT